MGALDSGIQLAALQQSRGTIPPAERRPLWIEQPAWLPAERVAISMTSPAFHQFKIQGVTLDGRTFRPSDWAERLAGVMSIFRPDGVKGSPGVFLGYSPYCVPRIVDGVKCVIVDDRLRDIEPKAWDFVMNFARDNELRVAPVEQPVSQVSPDGKAS